jgi:hypothetical protein
LSAGSKLLCVTGPLARAEPKTLRWRLWHAPARLIRHARQDIVRILDGWPDAPAIVAAHARHRRARLTPARSQRPGNDGTNALPHWADRPATLPDDRPAAPRPARDHEITTATTPKSALRFLVNYWG